MAVQMHVVEWVIECIARKAGAPKMRMAKDGTFTSDPALARKFQRFVDADRARHGLRTPTQVVEL